MKTNKYYKAIAVVIEQHLAGKLTEDDLDHLIKLITAKYVENRFMEKYLPKFDKMVERVFK